MRRSPGEDESLNALIDERDHIAIQMSILDEQEDVKNFAVVEGLRNQREILERRITHRTRAIAAVRD